MNKIRQLAKRIRNVFFAIAFILSLLGFRDLEIIKFEDQGEYKLNKFDLISETSGWILLNEHLFWTDDFGQTWVEISPTLPTGGQVLDISFLDSNSGWLLWSSLNPGGTLQYNLASTTNRGLSWTSQGLSLFSTTNLEEFPSKVHMGWLDLNNGWIAIRLASGVNFSKGVIFTTSDKGKTWTRNSLPVADNVDFNDPLHGWAIGGPGNNQIFITRDAGTTWQDANPISAAEREGVVIYAPRLTGNRGILLTTNLYPENQMRIFATTDHAASWQELATIPLESEPGHIAVSALDPSNFIATIPGADTILQSLDGKLQTTKNADGQSASITELDMATTTIGWAKWVYGGCNPDLQTCTSTTRLLSTNDGGKNWQSIKLPILQSNQISIEYSAQPTTNTLYDVTGTSSTEVMIGQGFDRCEIPTLSQMGTWWNNSPFEAVNLYIGGSSRACTNSALSAAYLRQLYQYGWKFIPTWVGPQAPCSFFLSKMDSDPTAAYTQGVNEANLAVNRLAELGLTLPDKTGSVIYYDIEPYGTDLSCRAAVNSFMDGWVTQLNVLGNTAGVYGSTLCNTGLSDFLTIPHVPDAIWPARWYHNAGSGSYDPTATVWDLGSCIPNTVWNNHQRIRQYEGAHYETWGTLTLDIDNDVLDGIVAIPVADPVVSSIARANLDPTSAAAVNFTVIFSEWVTGVDKSDFSLAITDQITAASVIGVSGSGYFYTVSVDTGTGNGTIRLDLNATGTGIQDTSGNPLIGGYKSGEFYTISRNNPPTDIALSHSSIDENMPANSEIGNLSTTDPDPGDTFTYSFCGGNDDASFQINGFTLESAITFDYETKSSYSICIQSTDSTNLYTTKFFTISINNIDENAPPLLSYTGSTTNYQPPDQVTRYRFAKANLSLLVDGNGQVQLGIDQNITLNLFDDAFFIATIQQVQQENANAFSWVGSLQGIDTGQVIIIATDGIISAQVNTGNEIYAVHFVENDLYLVVQIDQSVFPEDQILPVPASVPPK